MRHLHVSPSYRWQQRGKITFTDILEVNCVALAREGFSARAIAEKIGHFTVGQVRRRLWLADTRITDYRNGFTTEAQLRMKSALKGAPALQEEVQYTAVRVRAEAQQKKQRNGHGGKRNRLKAIKVAVK